MGVDLSGVFRPEYLNGDEHELTELVDADIPRVDLVGKGANGIPRFLIAKRADGPAGLMSADYVRGLIGKPEPVVKQEGETVTMTGSPGAIARFIHQAAVRTDPVAKADHDTSDGSLNGSVTKEMDMPVAAPADVAKADGDDLDPMTVLAEPDDDTAPGMATDPGSPAWEAVDAATARKWTGILARAKAAIDLLADREMLEAAAGDEDDAMQAMDLQDACCAIDYAIGVLAPFAVAEQAEADCCDDMTAVGKALDGFDPSSLDTIEALGHVRKAGRVLSSANEAAIRDAVDKLQKVLASLPQAPAAVEKSGQPVADQKESDMPEPTTSAETVAEHSGQPQMGVAKADESGDGNVAKADDVKPQMRAVYDAKGRLVGVVDEADITPIADAAPEPDDTPAADAGDAQPEAAPAEADMQPAPAAEVGTPADATDDGVAKTTAATSGDDSNSTADAIAKSIADVVKQQLEAASAAQQEALAKMANDLAAATGTIEVLKGQVQALEEQPATPKVFTNGAVPPGTQLRGQDRGAAPVDPGQVAELRKGLYSPVAAERDKAAIDMNALAIAQLQEIHQRR